MIFSPAKSAEDAEEALLWRVCSSKPERAQEPARRGERSWSGACRSGVMGCMRMLFKKERE